MLHVNAANGEVLWSVPLPSKFANSSAPIVLALEGGDVVLTGATDGNNFLELYDGTSGSVRWTIALGSCFPAILVNGVIVFGCLDVLSALSVTTGAMLWSSNTVCGSGRFETPTAQALVSVNDSTYLAVACVSAGQGTTTITVLEPVTGNVTYSTAIGASLDSVPAMVGVGSHVLIAQLYGLVAWDVVTGESLTITKGYMGFAPITVDTQGRIFCAGTMFAACTSGSHSNRNIIIIGSVVGGVVALLAVALFAVWRLCWRNNYQRVN